MTSESSGRGRRGMRASPVLLPLFRVQHELPRTRAARPENHRQILVFTYIGRAEIGYRRPTTARRSSPVASSDLRIMRIRLSYVMPIHNEAPTLEGAIDTLVERLREFPGSAIFLAENGSIDESFAVCERVAAKLKGGSVKVRALSTPNAGLGYGYEMGLVAALAEADPDPDPRSHFISLSAADLPFG